MADGEFSRGEQVWLGGREVTFLEYHRYAGSRIGAAVVRRKDARQTRVVALWKLARDRAESVARANAMPSR
jgi:hypothetical protein